MMESVNEFIGLISIFTVRLGSKFAVSFPMKVINNIGNVISTVPNDSCRNMHATER